MCAETASKLNRATKIKISTYLVLLSQIERLKSFAGYIPANYNDKI
jgi:hypothetical protein